MLATCIPQGSGFAEEALYIEARHSLLLKTERPIIRASVADKKVADVLVLTPTQVLVVAKTKKAASTNVILWYDDDSPKVHDVIIFNKIPHWILSELKTQLADIAPGVRIDVIEASREPDGEQILLKGSVESQEVLEQVLLVAESFGITYFNLIRLKGPQQVQLRVVIAEISKSGLRQMGINLLKTDGRDALGLLRGGAWEGTLPYDISLFSPFASAFEIVLAKSDWLSVIALLKSQGLARMLATPTLVTMNGQQAEFQVGGEYPIPVQGEQGSTSIEYKKYGIMLSFTPYIIDKNTITLEVTPEVSSPDYALGVTSGGASVPGLSSRKATTTLQLKPGQTFAMAGLLKEEYRQNIDKVPLLGDIPYIGTLFTTKETEYSESELVVIVTPTFVAPMDPAEVPKTPPGATIGRISDPDFFIRNLTEPESKKEQKPQYQFKGKSGFIK